MTDTDLPHYVELANTGILHAIPVAHGMGVTVVEAAPGFAVAEVPVDGNTNHFGSMYAGVLFTVGEILGGVIGLTSFDSSRFYPLVKELTISFLKPATTTVRARAGLDAESVAAIAAEADANGKADFVLEAELTDTDGVVVARTRGTYQIRAHGR